MAEKVWLEAGTPEGQGLDMENLVERLKIEHFDCCCLGQSFPIAGFSRGKSQFLKRKLDFAGKHEGEEQKVEGVGQGLLAGELRLCLGRKGEAQTWLVAHHPQEKLIHIWK